MGENERIQLSKAVSEIKKNIDVKYIYLFGSFAYGNPEDGSDLDICVIANELKERKIDIIKRIRRELMKTVDMPMDLLIYGKDEFDQRAALTTTMEYIIRQEGVLVYGQ